MFKIEFELENPNIRWSTEIHQLNSDILQRHILPKLHTNQYPLHFHFYEQSQQGDIFAKSGDKLGTFHIQ
nr:hypothetical protein [Vibrio japonicus]